MQVWNIESIIHCSLFETLSKSFYLTILFPAALCLCMIFEVVEIQIPLAPFATRPNGLAGREGGICMDAFFKWRKVRMPFPKMRNSKGILLKE